jgi:hypothetical protein
MKEKMDHRPWGLILGWLLVLGFCLLEIWPLLSGPGDLYLMDNLTLDVPLRVFAARRYWNGESLLWHDHLLCGVSPISEGQTGIFYPGFLLYLFHPQPEANDWYIAIHLTILATTFYSFAHKRTASPAASVVVTILLIHSQLLKIAHGNSGGLAIISLLPAALLMIEWAYEGKRGALTGAAVLNSLMVLTGVPNVAIVAWVTEFVFVIYLRARGSVTALMRMLLNLYVIPLFLSAAQVIPLFFYFLDSNRSGGASWETIGQRLVPTFFFIHSTYISPSMTGYAAPNPWAEYIWLSTTLGLIAIGAAFGRCRAERMFWLGISALFYFAASTTGMLAVFHVIPILNWFQWPQIYLVPAFLGGMMLAAHGAERVIHFVRTRPKSVQLAVLASSVAVAIFLSLDGYGKYLATGGLYDDADGIAERDRFYAVNRKVWPYDHLYVVCAESKGISIDKLKSAMTFFPGNVNLLFNVRHPFQNEILDTVSPGMIADLYRCAQERGHHAERNVALITGVTDWAGYSKKMLDGADPAGSTKMHHLHVRHPMSEGLVVHRIRVIPDKESRLAHLASESFDPRTESIVESSAVVDRCEPLTSGAAEEVVRVDTDPKFIRHISCRLNSKGLLVVPIRHQRFLRAKVDNVPVPIERVNHAMSGVAVDAGSHRVTFEFVPWDFYLGVVVSGVSWLGLFWHLYRSK